MNLFRLNTLKIRTCTALHQGHQRIVNNVRAVHARVEQTTSNQRNKQVLRPEQNFRSPGKDGRLRRSDSRFVLSPTSGQGPGRSKGTAAPRRQLQLAKSRDELIDHLQDAIQSLMIDPSVFSAAMQRCGQGRWWDTLLQVRQLQRESGVALDTIAVGIFLKSLTQSVRGEHGFGAVQARANEIVRLGRQAWAECPRQDMITANTALHLCAVASREEGIKWAEELWAWAPSQGFKPDVLSYTALALVFAVHGPSTRLDELLAQASSRVWTPNSVTLGALVNACAEKQDWQRAEEIWKKLVHEVGVEPQEIAFAARAKAHLLCGRPATAAEIIDSMRTNGAKTQPLAELHAQASLLVYHSSMEPAALARLQAAFETGEAVMKDASAHQRRTWTSLKLIARRLQAQPSSVNLRDVLVEWKATQSVMSRWPNHKAGSNYIAALR